MATQAPSPAAETLDGLEQEAVASPRLSPMTRYYLRRLGLYIITLWGALTASFFFFRLLPGDPISGIITQLQSRGVYSSITQSATLIAWVVGILIGTLVGWKRDSFISSWVTNFCLVFSNIPAYFIALVLIIFLSYRWRLLPPNGAYNAALQPGWDLHFIGSAIKYGTLPVIATAITGAAGWIIGTRALIVTLLGEDFLTYAKATGLTPRRSLFRYVLRNAWLPQIAALGISMGFVVTGTVLIERLFRYPGVGKLLVDSVVIKDVNTAMAVVTVLIFMVLTINLIIDLILPIFDPRVKYGD